MGRLGYLLLGAVIAVLATVVFWPESAAVGGRVPFLADLPTVTDLVLVGEQHRQEWDGATLLVDGVNRTIDGRRLAAFQNTLGSLLVEPEAVIAGRDPASYGIDGGWRLVVAGTTLLRWGRKGGTTWVHDPRDDRLAALDERGVRQLTALQQRLDEPRLLTVGEDWETVTIAGQTYQVDAEGRWRAALEPNRPWCTQRIGQLRHALRQVELLALRGIKPAAVVDPVALTIDTAAGRRMTVRFGTGAPGGWIDVADQPIQPLPSAQLARLRELCLALAEDPLYEFVSSPSNAKADRITVSRAGAEVFRLRRHGANDRLPTGGSAWSVIVDGLQLPAAKDVGRRFEAALAAVRITDPVRHLAALAGPDELGTPPALAITFTGDQLAKPRWLAVAGGRLIGRVVEGYQAVLPEILASPDPDAYLDPELLAVAPDRIRKIQLAESQGAVTAVRVLDRPGGRQWRLQKLQASGDQVNRQPVGDLAAVAVEALVRGLTAVQATKVRRATAADHVAHARSLTVRVGPAEVRAAERHAVQDQDSIEQDLAWFLWRDGTDWLARDQDGLLVFTLPAMVVERLWAPLDRPLVLPVVPGQVVEVAFQRPDAEVPARLRRGPTGWRVVRSDATSAAADADEIERFLIRLAGLEGQPVPDAMPLDPLAATTVGELTLQMADAPAPWHLIIGRPLAGVVPVSAQIPGLRTAPVVHLAVDPSTLWPPIERFIASESLLQEE